MKRWNPLGELYQSLFIYKHMQTLQKHIYRGEGPESSVFKKVSPGTSRATQQLKTSPSNSGGRAQVRSLVRELSSHMPHGQKTRCHQWLFGNVVFGNHWSVCSLPSAVCTPWPPVNTLQILVSCLLSKSLQKQASHSLGWDCHWSIFSYLCDHLFISSPFLQLEFIHYSSATTNNSI